MKKTVFVLALLLFSLNVFAIVENSEMKVLAVTSDGRGLGADLFLEVESGQGKIWVSADPLVGTTTQSAARTAKDVAKKFSVNVDGYDYKFSIDSAASLVEGPSAGAAMALMIISSLQDKSLPSNVSVTGTIDVSGNVGPVGGVFEKAQEAANLGIDLFMIPKGEEIQTVRIGGRVESINLLEYGPTNFGIKIVSVNNIDDVLNFAFSDIKEIDISQIIAESSIPDFVPQKVELKSHLELMKKLVDDYIVETNLIIEEAKNAASTAIIDDQALVNTLLDTLTSAQQTMKQAEILNEQNYLYSAANFAFLARVNALIVKDVSTNPSLLNVNSTVLDLKVQELKKEIVAFEQLLDNTIPVDFLEWYISAQQRLSYAKINVEKLSGTQILVINGVDDFSRGFEELTEYEFAVAWVDVAKDFYEITTQSTKRILPSSAFSDSMNELLVKAEQELQPLPMETAQDIERRLVASKLEKTKGWYLASVFDAATAFALASSESLVQGKEYSELSSVLESKINGLEEKMENSTYAFSWPNLYLTHSKYFLESAKYYAELNQTARAVNSLQSGISLILLAEQLFLVAEPMYSFYEKVSPSDLVQRAGEPVTTGLVDSVSKFFPILSNSVLLTGFLVVVVLFFVVSTYFLVQLSSRQQTASTSKELFKLKELQRKVDFAVVEGKISEKKHSELSEKYSLELALLEKQHKDRASKILELDKDRAQVIALERRLRDLKSHFNAGLLSPQEFKKARNEISFDLVQAENNLSAAKKLVEKDLKKTKKENTLEVKRFKAPKDAIKRNLVKKKMPKPQALKPKARKKIVAQNQAKSSDQLPS